MLRSVNLRPLPAFLVTHRYLALALAGALFVVFWGLPTLVIPFSADQSWFSLGARTILDGDQPYQDFWDQKTPLIYLVYAVPYAIAGEHFEAVRVLDLANTFVAMGGVFLLTRRFFNERAAALAAAVYGFVYLTSTGFDGLAETESFIAGPLTLAVALYPVRGSGARVWGIALVSGLLLGLAFGLKFSVLPFVLALPALELLLRDRERWDRWAAVQRLTCAAAGFLVLQAAWLGYLAAAGVLGDFIDIQRDYTLPYQDLRWAPNGWSTPRFIAVATEDWLSMAWYITVPALTGLLVALLRGPRLGAYVIGLLVAFAILSVWWQGKFFRYHWIIAMPVLAPLAGYAFDQAFELLRGLAAPRLAAVAAVLVFALAVMYTDPLLATYDGYNYLMDRASGELRQEEINTRYVPLLAQNQELAGYVRQNSTPEEALYIWGVWPQALFMADRVSVTRYVANSGLRATWTEESLRRELIDDLERGEPRFIAVAAGDRQPWLTGTNETSDEHFCNSFPELRSLVEDNYQPVLNNGLFVLYDRGAAQPLAPGSCG